MKTPAQEAMSAALARGASGKVVALNELSADDLMAGISDDTRAELVAKLAAEAPTPEAETPAETVVDNEPAVTEEANAGGEPEAEASDAGHARIKAVAASDAAKANPATALSILADDDYRGLSADAVIKLVGNQASAADPEAAARAVMRETILSAGGSTVDPNGSGASPDQSAANLWDRVIARVPKP